MRNVLNAEPTKCGTRNAECGIRDAATRFDAKPQLARRRVPRSAFRIPHLKRSAFRIPHLRGRHHCVQPDIAFVDVVDLVDRFEVAEPDPDAVVTAAL
jgi:hypothetical protein